MLNSLQLWPFYRDTWGYYDAHVNPLFAPLDSNRCYKPKYYEVPDVSVQLMSTADTAAAPAYQQYTLRIQPGTLLLGWLNDDDTPLFTVQISDVSTGHKFWDQPVSNYFLTNALNEYPSLLATPYPVVGSGLFNVELRIDPNISTDEVTRCGFTVVAAEPVEPCQ